jgi:hypothetical protein
MSLEPRDPTNPLEWLRRARSNLARARAGIPAPEVLHEDLTFDAQQAAEKAIKAVLVAKDVEFPKTHALFPLHRGCSSASSGIHSRSQPLLLPCLTFHTSYSNRAGAFRLVLRRAPLPRPRFCTPMLRTRDGYRMYFRRSSSSRIALSRFCTSVAAIVMRPAFASGRSKRISSSSVVSTV